MKKMIVVFLLAAVTGAAFAASVRVSVKSAKLRKSPQFFAPAVGEAAYGDSLEVVRQAAGWYRVRSEDAEGWLHRSAVSSGSARKLGGGRAGSEEASADELTLAGKGFSEGEREYARQSGGADFASVDRLEARAVEQPALLEFLKRGGLLPRAKGRRR